MGPADARRLLMDGYTRYVIGHPEHHHQSSAYRLDVAAAPQPFAVVLGCADSRVPPEIIFDQGFGDLFVVRVAGAVVTDDVLASVELAVLEMPVSLVVALGHTHCRAVHACAEIVACRATVAGHEAILIDAMRPALEGTLDSEAAVRAAVRWSAERLQAEAPIVRAAVERGTLEIAGWLYDVDTGTIEMLA
jgi:carbonic anhydrase